MKCRAEHLTYGHFENITYYKETGLYFGEFKPESGCFCDLGDEYCESLSDLVWFLIYLFELEDDEDEVHSELLSMAEDFFVKCGDII